MATRRDHFPLSQKALGSLGTLPKTREQRIMQRFQPSSPIILSVTTQMFTAYPWQATRTIRGSSAFFCATTCHKRGIRTTMRCKVTCRLESVSCHWSRHHTTPASRGRVATHLLSPFLYHSIVPYLTTSRNIHISHLRFIQTAIQARTPT